MASFIYTIWNCHLVPTLLQFYKLTNTAKIISALIGVEAALTAYYFYSQPQCEPCLPNIPCEPCISKEQIMTFRTGSFIAVFTLGYLLYINIRRIKIA
jgi:hypothetical protein